MTARVTIVDRIIAAIAVQVQTVDGFGVQVGGIIRRDKSAPLGAIITGVAVVKARVVIVVIATVADGICVGDRGIGGLRRNRTVALGIIQIFLLYA